MIANSENLRSVSHAHMVLTHFPENCPVFRVRLGNIAQDQMKLPLIAQQTLTLTGIKLIASSALLATNASTRKVNIK